MKRYLFDIEADNLLARAEHIWCIVMIDMDTEEVFTYNPQQLSDAVDVLRDADEVIGHNITGYDIYELERHFGKIFKEGCRLTDTLILSRLLFPKLKLSDFKLAQKLTLPSRLIGSHSLEAWGYRLGERKIEYNDYSKFTQEMLTYCVQDCKTNLKLYNHLMGRYASVENKQEFDDALDMETRVSCIISEQTVNGFYFDIKKCEELYAELSNKKEGLYQKLVKEYPPRVVEEEFIPKVNNKARGYVKGVPTIKRKVIPFNPNSNQHIARILKEDHGWKPDVFTNSGQAKVDEAILSTLDYEIIPELLEYLMLSKRLGQVGDGAMAWLKLYNHKTHCMHGLVNSMGTRTRRMTHNNPNVAQTPAKPKPYWEECRGCFTAPPGRVLVGCDADGLELRMLAHFMAFFDGGEYAKTILYGNKEDGTDAHTLNARLLGVPRDVAKTWFYAFIYGAGNVKLGTVGSPKGLSQRKYMMIGKKRRAQFLKGLPALAKLTSRCEAAHKQRSSIRLIDGIRVLSSSSHSALNTLLQGSGAVIMKRAQVIAHDYVNDIAKFSATIHDEYQVHTRPGDADRVGKLLAQAIKEAGEYYKMNVPLSGAYSIGKNWMETH